MSPIDAAALKKDFPLLEREVDGRPLVYLDSAATSQKPRAVLDALNDFYEQHNANVHRGVYALAEEATAMYEAARHNLAAFVGADPRGLVFTRGTTEAVNLVAHSWARPNLKPGDEILLTELEHHSNIVPWQLAAQATGAILRWVPVTDDGLVELEAMSGLITDRTKLVAISGMSNVLGTIPPVAEIATLAHDAGALVLVDGAQMVCHMPVDMAALGVDFLTVSGHKMLGPTGIGALVADPEVLDVMEPFHGGGEMISEVFPDRSTYKEIPNRFEAGTPAIAQAVGLGAAVDYLERIGMEAVRDHERELTAYALERLPEVGARVFGPADPDLRGDAVSFWLEGVHPHDLAQLVDREGVAIRAGHHCAQILMRRLGVPATSRASFYVYNLREDVDALVEALGKAKAVFE
ncbi:MAG TPA: cysteine desulfurase [Actinomycetota bacterium]|nr:cysteine desulfurase [Actinomycetota bacterium]